MSYVETKLQNFTYTVMKEAAEKRKEILKEAEEKKKELLEKKEIDLLKEAYEKIQRVVRKSDKEKNENISRAIFESKRELFLKRQQIIDDIFNEVRQRIFEIKDQDMYVKYLVDGIKEGINKVGQGNIIVEIDKSDEDKINKIKGDINKDLDIQVVNNLIGGSKVINTDKKIMIDLSIEKKLEMERERFLKESGLIIE